MTATDETRIPISTQVADTLAFLTEQLRRSTVQVQGRRSTGGSGLIWQSDGLIITNAHVVQGAQATVELADGRRFKAIVTHKDVQLDLAALQIEATNLPAAVIGDAKQLRVGELVLAIGHPLGLVGALSIGMLHAISPVSRQEQEWLQADIRLAPGNSGGPLANAQGQVVGINSMIVNGLALAIPSHTVERFLYKPSARPYLGVTTQPVLVPLAGKRTLGLLVLEIKDGSPAEQAGLFPGDVLIGVDSHYLRRPEDLALLVRWLASGDGLQLHFIRGGVPMTCQVVWRSQSSEVEAA